VEYHCIKSNHLSKRESRLGENAKEDRVVRAEREKGNKKID